MDKQRLQHVADKLAARLDRRPPQPMLVYGRRLAPAAGFSLAELDEAGLTQAAAADLGLPVDEGRMSSLGTNVESLRRFARADR